MSSNHEKYFWKSSKTVVTWQGGSVDNASDLYSRSTLSNLGVDTKYSQWIFFIVLSIYSQCRSSILKGVMTVSFLIRYSSLLSADRYALLSLTYWYCRHMYYSRTNSAMSPASCAGNIRQPGLTSQVGRVREFECDYISVFFCNQRVGGASIFRLT